MNNEIKVAVIMPAYNCESTVRSSILSVINQTYSNWHLYIINDCSTDNTSIILREFLNNNRITIINNEKNIGAADSRNAGIDISTEPVIAFIDSDDIWSDDKLTLQIKEVDKGEKFIVTEYNFVNHTTKKSFPVLWRKCHLTKEDFLKKKFRICFSSLLYIRCDNKFKRIGHEDFVFLFELFNAYGNAKVINQSLVDYISIESSLSSDKKKAILWHIKCLKYIFNDNYFKIFFYFAYYMANGLMFKRMHK